MSLSNYPDKLLGILLNLVVLLLVVLVTGQLLTELLCRLAPADFLWLLAFLVCTSPLAYLIREARRRRPQRQRTRRGAERTPLLPTREEDL